MVVGVVVVPVALVEDVNRRTETHRSRGGARKRGRGDASLRHSPPGPLSDPVKKVPRRGGPGPRGPGIKGALESTASDYRFPYRGWSSRFDRLHGALREKRVYKLALTALRRSFVPICSTRPSLSLRRDARARSAGNPNDPPPPPCPARSIDPFFRDADPPFAARLVALLALIIYLSIECPIEGLFPMFTPGFFRFRRPR